MKIVVSEVAGGYQWIVYTDAGRRITSGWSETHDEAAKEALSFKIPVGRPKLDPYGSYILSVRLTREQHEFVKAKGGSEYIRRLIQSAIDTE